MPKTAGMSVDGGKGGHVMLGKLARLLILPAIGAMLTGCATIDTGYVDYRRAQDPVDVPAIVGEYICERSEDDDALRRRVCEPLLAVDLVRKNVSGKVGIKENDVYSIRLDHGFMRYVSELPFRPDRILDGKNPLRAQAEIVVLARAFEFGPQAMADVDATPDAPAESGGGTTAAVAAENAFVEAEFKSLNEARVIYYSPDVENGQSLNFSNIPILGPVKYGGRPVGIQLIVLELDRVSPEMKGLLSSLASIGQTAGAIPTGGAANVLINLGKSLLESNQDDMIFEYRFVLDPSDKVNSYNSAPFEEGRYVLRRLQSRSNAHVWRDIQLDHNTGQLYLDRTTAGEDAVPYTGETYFTVNIINHGPSAKEAVYVYQSLQQLRTVIAASATATDSAVITALNGEIEAATLNLRGDTITRELATLWEGVVGDAVRLAYTSPPESLPIDAGCELVPQDGADKNLAELELAQSVADFARRWNEAVAQDAAKAARFGDDERRRVASAAGSFFFGLGNAPAHSRPSADAFVDPAAFNALVNDSGTPSFLDRIRAYAGAMAPKTCPQLLGSGLARRPRPARPAS